ncbi:MAG TPA: SDR family oxidoreductase [Hyphomicrobiaceae bacterium]|nr:SDR family oxidoreductase [Hyphomicrobiaceae bacterium]
MNQTGTVLITGASSGIGRATAELFADRGWSVAATMRSPESSDLGAASDRIRVFRLDVTDRRSIEAAVTEAIAAFGRIDVLVNNAGYGLIGLFEEMSEEQVRRQLDTNVLGLMNVTRAVLPHMRSQRSGCIINVASAAGRFTLPLYTLYCTSKWAIEGFSEGLGFEVAQHGITVKIIEPGAIKSEFFGRSLEVPARGPIADYGDWAARVFANIKARCVDIPGPGLVARSIFKAATARPGWRLRYKPNGRLLILGRLLVPAEIHNLFVRFLLGAW